MKEKIKNKLKQLFSVWFIVCFCFFLVGLTINIIATNNAEFADFFQVNIGSFFRAALAFITNILPFSLAESVVITSPFIAVTLIYIENKSKSDTWTATIRYSLNLFAVAFLILTILFVNFGSGYHTTSLDKRLGLERKAVSASELEFTSQKLVDGIYDNINKVDFINGSSSVMPYDFDTMCNKLNKAYEKACEKYTFLSKFYSKPKQLALSEPITYTHIAGVYTFFTGEANINVNFPDYTLPYTAAHEMAHQRGIAREEEANFVAFLVCLESDDAYIKYSAYVSVYEYVANAFYDSDKDAYKAFYYRNIDDRLRGEFVAFSTFFEKYRQNAAATVSGAINNGYLQSQGQSAGIKSYDLVVDLAVAYYKNGNN